MKLEQVFQCVPQFPPAPLGNTDAANRFPRRGDHPVKIPKRSFRQRPEIPRFQLRHEPGDGKEFHFKRPRSLLQKLGRGKLLKRFQQKPIDPAAFVPRFGDAVDQLGKIRGVGHFFQIRPDRRKRINQIALRKKL